jgi:ubiquinone/menaquinone biosynthesis C-methylase UbiE
MSDSSAFFVGTEMPDDSWWTVLWADPAAILKRVGIKPGMRVIDLCSGNGRFTLPLAKIASRVVAIDIDPTLLETARIRIREAGLTNCDFCLGNAFDVESWVLAPVNFVFMANVFHGVPDKARLSKIVHRVLAPGGRFAIVNWHQRPREQTCILGEPRGPKTELRMSPEQTREAAEAGGLGFVKLVELPPYHYALIFKRD